MQQLEGYFEALFEPEGLLHTWRKKAWDRFLELGLPSPKQEAFQYLSLKDFRFPSPAALLTETVLPCPPCTLRFEDGFFQTAHLPAPLVCMKMDAAMLVYGAFLQNRLSRSLKEESDPFAAMNGAFQGSGAFLYVPPKAHIEQPIEIAHRFSSPGMASSRLQVFLGQGASIRLVQRISGAPFSNLHIDANLDAGASLFLGEKEENATVSFKSLRVTLKQGSRLHYLSLSEGGKLSRSSIKAQLLEENAEALFQGLCRLDADRQHHTHLLVEHLAPRTRSRQHFKALLFGKSRSSFEGKIYVKPEAAKTEAYQLHNALLLSDEAQSYAKPNLEIFEGDVKASHGATVSQLKEEELFYFRSRGYTLALAQEALAAGFCKEILNASPAGVTL